MSLVGPRPEDPALVKAYAPQHLEVLNVKPGITSPASIMNRYEEDLLTDADWEETYRRVILPAKLSVELEYLRRRTLADDLRILAQTVTALFRRRARVGE